MPRREGWWNWMRGMSNGQLTPEFMILWFSQLIEITPAKTFAIYSETAEYFAFYFSVFFLLFIYAFRCERHAGGYFMQIIYFVEMYVIESGMHWLLLLSVAYCGRNEEKSLAINSICIPFRDDSDNGERHGRKGSGIHILLGDQVRCWGFRLIRRESSFQIRRRWKCHLTRDSPKPGDWSIPFIALQGFWFMLNSILTTMIDGWIRFWIDVIKFPFLL